MSCIKVIIQFYSLQNCMQYCTLVPLETSVKSADLWMSQLLKKTLTCVAQSVVTLPVEIPVASWQGNSLYFHFSCIPSATLKAGNAIQTAAVCSLRSIFVPVMSRLLSRTQNYELDLTFRSETLHAICSYSRCGSRDCTDDAETGPVDGGTDSTRRFVLPTVEFPS